MANLDAAADQAVHDAVDAFIEGRWVPAFVGATIFETKNSRYRLLDGIVVEASDSALHGAELVGWLCELRTRCTVTSMWKPGSRAVLVARRRERSIIVTSTTRLIQAQEGGTNADCSPAAPPAAQHEFRSWHPPPPPNPTSVPLFPSQRAPILASTPPPGQIHAEQAEPYEEISAEMEPPSSMQGVPPTVPRVPFAVGGQRTLAGGPLAVRPASAPPPMSLSTMRAATPPPPPHPVAARSSTTPPGTMRPLPPLVPPPRRASLPPLAPLELYEREDTLEPETLGRPPVAEPLPSD